MIKITLCTFVTLITSIVCDAQTGKADLTDNKMRTFIDSAVNKAVIVYLQDTNTNGISIGIYFRNSAYAYNYGEVKRGSKILPSTQTFYNVGSVAKTFISVMLAEAIIERKAALTDDIRKFLPKGYDNLEYQGHPVRLVDLANHTSGLPKEFHHFSTADLEKIEKLDLAGQINYFNRYTRDSLLADLHQIKPDSIPGTRYQYNGNATILLMLIIERIYHQSYEKIVTKFLSDKLKMYDTKTTLTKNEMKRLAQGYNDDNQPQQYANYHGFIGGPSMNSTVGDLLKYLEANIAGKNNAISLTQQLTWGEKNGFAIGLSWMMDSNNNGERYIYHDGHTGAGFNTHFIFYPKQKMGFVIIVNDIIDQEKLIRMERSIKAVLDMHVMQ